ncbi:MAG: serine/threonine protein kinase [Planctomycetota bacterium]
MIKWILSKLGFQTPVRGYEVEEQIFEGAFSNIYRAVRVPDNQIVALKVLTEAGEKMATLLDDNPKTVWEGELLRSLDHPNIVKCFDSGIGSNYWLSMEYVESHLKSYVGVCRNKEEENRIIELCNQIVSALEYVHSRGYVHRDICLSNLLVSEDGTAQLIDFGMAVPQGCQLLQGRVGTPSYMAPEMIKTSHYTASADMYSLGIVMYELITGQKPFGGEMKEQRMTRSLNFDPHPPSEHAVYCSKELDDLVMRCMSKDVDERPGEARELAHSLFILRRRRGLT